MILNMTLIPAKKYVVLFVLFYVSVVAGATKFTNFTSTIRYNAIVEGGDAYWVASSGGLIRISKKSNNIELLADSDDFPDLALVGVDIDKEGNVWMCSERGYVYKRSSAGKVKTLKYYLTSNWNNLRKVKIIDDYLLVIADEGLSFFNMKNEKIYNAERFGNLKESVVYDIAFYNNLLYVASKGGVVTLKIEKNFNTTIGVTNFLDKNVWSTVVTDFEVKSLPIIDNTVFYSPHITASRNGKEFTAHPYKKFTILGESRKDTMDTVIDTLPSKVTSMLIDNSDNLWVSTTDNYAYRWDGNELKQFRKRTIPFFDVSKVYTSSDGHLWALPTVVEQVDSPKVQWWIGIAELTKQSWNYYSTERTRGFGELGGGKEEFLGICEDPSGNIWYGTSGYSIKKYDRRNDKWRRYYINRKTGTFYRTDGSGSWGECNAIVRDKNDNMWFAAYKSQRGVVCAFDHTKDSPSKSDYRFFFDSTSSLFISEPTAMTVDINGNVIVGGDNGELMAFQPHEDPIRNGIKQEIMSDKVRARIWDMAPSGDGATWIATADGLYLFNIPQDKSHSLQRVDFIGQNVKGVEVEYHRERLSELSDGLTAIETSLWVSTQNEGIFKFKVTYHRDTRGNISFIKLADDNDSKIHYTERDGLISNDILSIHLDKKNGYLWIGTKKGISRFSVGNITGVVSDNNGVVAYPNPFIRKKHKEITFENIAPNSVINVYTIDGRLVEKITPQQSKVVKNHFSWTYTWTPHKKLIPSTYIYVVKVQDQTQTSTRGTARKLMILPPLKK